MKSSLNSCLSISLLLYCAFALARAVPLLAETPVIKGGTAIPVELGTEPA